MLYWNCNSGQMAKVPGHQRVGEERRVVHPRGGMPPRCRVFSWTNAQGGMSGDHTAHSSFKGCLYMPLNPGRRKQKGWFVTVTGMVSQGWTLRQMCLLSSSWDTGPPEKNWGVLPSGVYVKEAAWTPAMWVHMSAGSNPGHFVFFKGPPTVEERWLFRREQRNGAC